MILFRFLLKLLGFSLLFLTVSDVLAGVDYIRGAWRNVKKEIGKRTRYLIFGLLFSCCCCCWMGIIIKQKRGRERERERHGCRVGVIFLPFVWVCVCVCVWLTRVPCC